MHPSSIDSRAAAAGGHSDQWLTRQTPSLDPPHLHSHSTGPGSPSPLVSQPSPSGAYTPCCSTSPYLSSSSSTSSSSQQKITATDVAVIGNGPAGMIMSLLLSGYEPYFHAQDASTPHPDTILQRALAASDFAGEHPRSFFDQNLPSLAAHIHHQLAEAGRDANPIGAMFDSLAHPNIDTQRGEYPSFLTWTTQPRDPTTATQSQQFRRSARKSHVVLGRGDIGGIWADMDHDHTQTLSYAESMELPLYTLADFVKQHPGEYDGDLERPVRATVSAYYKEYTDKMGIRDHFWTHTTITDVFHLKDLENHCCCYLDPDLPVARDDDTDKWSECSDPPSSCQTCRECAQYRYALLGYQQQGSDRTDAVGDIGGQKRKEKTRRQYFLLRCKTLALATGTFDQSKKLPLNILRSKASCSDPSSMISGAAELSTKNTNLPSPTPMFYDTRSLDDWITATATSATETEAIGVSPPAESSALNTALLPIVIVGTGLSAADAILLIREREPCRPIFHLYRYATASEPSPLKRCHKDVYPEYASIWTLMKKSATRSSRRNAETTSAISTSPSVVSSTSTAPGSYYKTCCEHSNAAKSKEPCDCQNVKALSEWMPPSSITGGVDGASSSEGQQALAVFPTPCLGCVYNGLADATLSGWNPSSGRVEIILSSGLRVQHRVAAIGVFIGKQVNMGFLKGSLALDFLQAPPDSTLLTIPVTAPHRNKLYQASGNVMSPKQQRQQQPLESDAARERPDKRKSIDMVATDIPTPPRTPPFLPAANNTSKNLMEQDLNDDVDDSTEEDSPEDRKEDEDLTALKPLVTDMWTMRVVAVPRTARPLRPSLLQRAITSRSTSTSASTPASPTLPAVFTHCVPTGGMQPPVSSSESTFVSPVPLLRDTSQEHDIYNHSSLPSPAEEAAVPLSSRQGEGEGQEISSPSAWGAVTCVIQRASKALSQSLSSGNTPLSRSCPQATHSTSDLPQPPCDPKDRGASSQHLHFRQTRKCETSAEVTQQNATLISQIKLPDPPCCFSMPCSPVLSCIDSATATPAIESANNGQPQQQRRYRPLLLSIPSFLTLGQPSVIQSAASSIIKASVRATMSDTMTVICSSLSSSGNSGEPERRRPMSSFAAITEATEPFVQQKEEQTEVQDKASGGPYDDAFYGTQAQKHVQGDTRGEDECHDHSSSIESRDTVMSSLLPPLLPCLQQGAPTAKSANPPQPLMDQSIYAVGAVTGSKFVRFILGHCVAAVSDMLNSEMGEQTAAC